MAAGAEHNPEAYRRVWREKAILRTVYEDLYRRMAARLADGPTLEIGGGSGNFAAFAPDTVSTDIVYAHWLDVVCDAQRLPFASGAWSNIVMMDVLHHIERPVRFFESAVQALRPGGRIVVCEPAITPVSGLFYRLLHPEPVDMSADPLAEGPIDPDRDPFDSNQAIPTLLFGKVRHRFEERFPALHVIEHTRLSFFVYPLSGGFRPWSLVPNAIAGPALTLEWAARHVLGPFMAYRLIGVIEVRQ